MDYLIIVRLFTILREVTKKKDIPVDIKAPVTVQRVLDHLTREYPALVPLLFENDNNRTVKSYYLVVVNGRALRDNTMEEVMNHQLDESDVLAILPPVGGG